LFLLVVAFGWLISGLSAASGGEPSDSGEGRQEARRPVVITSKTMEADNRRHRAVFTGQVVAEADGMSIQAERMEVSYNAETGQVERIVCGGGVRVIREGRAILSEEAVYDGQEEKISFSGDPRIMEGDNLVTGSSILYYPKTDRLIVENSRVYMQAR